MSEVNMAVERYGNKTDVVVKLILVFFISLLSFSIGTFVGKKFSDNQHKISQLESGAGEKDAAGHEDRSVASVANQGDEKTKDALSSEEIAKLAEEFVADDEKPAGEKEAGHAKAAAAEAHGEHGETAERKISSEETHGAPAKHEEPTIELKKDTVKHEAKSEEHAAEKHADKKSDKVGHAADNVAEGKAAHEGEAHVEKKATPATALPKSVAANAAGKYTVQVAAYPKEEEAQNMAGDLKNKGFSAFYVPAQVKGQTWYRVSVGLFTTQKEAQAYREDLLSRAKVGSAMVQKITQ
jgi:cell division protein FtsN